MREVVNTTRFKKDFVKIKKRGKNIKKLQEIILLLVDGKQLPAKNKNHKLKGEYNDCWECHIEPDWLLIYEKSAKEIVLLRTGTHADLFE